MFIYPNLTDDVTLRLKAIELAARGNPDYFTDPECPYSESMKGYLKRLIEPTSGSVELKRTFDVAEGDKFDLVQSEIEDTIDQMKTLESRITSDNVTLDPAERISLIKAKTQLLEKWIGLRSQILTLKEMAVFQATVIAFMDQVLTKDQIAEFRKRLAGLRSVSGVGVAVVAANDVGTAGGAK